MTDLSQKVSAEGLALLGWCKRELNSYHYHNNGHRFFVYPGRGGEYPDTGWDEYTRFDNGDWRFDGVCLRGPLQPRTLREVKFLMDRAMEND
jgi:hypothetical protein